MDSTLSFKITRTEVSGTYRRHTRWTSQTALHYMDPVKDTGMATSRTCAPKRLKVTRSPTVHLFLTPLCKEVPLTA